MIVILMISTVFATASNIGLVKAEEPTLVSILQELGFTNIEESTVETFMPAGTYNITLYAEFAGYHESNNLSWYQVGTSEYDLIFSGPEGNQGYIYPPISKIFAVKGEFGLSFHSPEARYFTETGRNPDGIKHAKILYMNLDNPDMYLIGFENTLGGGDEDYNDMVISLELVSQPVNIAGVNWYIANTTSDKVLIYLDGAFATPLKVIVRGWDEDKTTEEANFLSKMVSGGFDVIFNKNAFSYDGSETIVKDTATWLLNNGYERVFLFGWSGGGVVVAYEVQKEYASTSYSAAVISSAPVNWDSFSDAPIFQSAHTAERDKVATCFIEGEGDGFYDQMSLYFSNTIVGKEWHTWNGEHNIFLNTCKDHLGEDAQTVAINWFNAERLYLVIDSENEYGYHEITSSITEELAKIGINVAIDYRDAATISNTVWGAYWDKTWNQAPGYGWDMVWYEFNSAQDYLDQNLKSHYWANMTPPNGGYNIMCWNNKKADEILCKAMNTPNALAKKSDIWNWQIAFMHDPPCIIIYYPSTPMCARGIAFNLHHPVLSNRYVRLAIAHAIPYGHIINITLPKYGIDAYQAKAPIHRDAKYTYGGVTVSLYCDDNSKLPYYSFNITQAQKYMEMWWYSKVGKDKMKGPRGDSDFSGFVELDDFYIWVKWWGKYTSQITFLPGQDQDPDWDNSGYVEMPDFYEWTKAWGFYYPENSTEHKWSRSPVTPLGPTEYPAIYVEPASIEKTTYEPGMEFTVSIRTNYTGADVTGWQFTLYYNPLVLEGVNVTNGDLITKEKDSSAQFVAGTFNNTAGKLSLTGAFFFFLDEPAPLTSGPGTLAKVTFKVVGWGDSGILLGDKTKLISFTEDGWGTKIDIIDASTDPNHIQNGFFSNLVLTIRPNAPGTFTRWTAYPSGTPNWQCVDEASPNDDADYVYWTPQPSKQDSYNLEDHTTETRNITNVRVVMYAKLASADDDQITMQLVMNGMTYEGVTVNPTTTYAKYTSDWAINPSTGLAWTWSDIDTLEAGFKCVKVGQTSPEHRITQLYVEVTLPRSYE